VAAYTVDARPRVRKALRQLDPTVRKDVLTKMRALATDPRPSGAKTLRGYPLWLRVRAGDYRIIYIVDDEARTVTVADIGHRREVYRNLDL
jgi:mRNA interferase RelE/StbE